MRFRTYERLIFKMEVRQCFSKRRISVFILASLMGIALIVQESEIPPLFIVVLMVFAILEEQFCNLMFRTPYELHALSMFRVSWRRIVLVKNLATIVLTLVLAVIMSMTILYFSPRPVEARMITDALLHGLTVLFPLLHAGNIESVRAPRRVSGWQADHFVQVMGMVLLVVVLSIPYVFISEVLRLRALNALYAAAVAWYWYAKSIPITALNIEQRKTAICSTR